jgi:hypothetical protein
LKRANRGCEVEFADVSFMVQFRQPQTWLAPDRSQWRLYSRRANVENRPVEVFVAYALQASWKFLDTPASLISEVDRKLREQAEHIVATIPQQATPRSPLDGYVVVDATTGAIRTWGGWPPVFLPASIRLPEPGWRSWLPRVNGSQICFVETDANERLVAMSAVVIGPLWTAAAIVAGAFAAGILFGRWVGKRFLRNYLAFVDVRMPTTDEALRRGEDQTIEFKRGLSDDSGKWGGPENELLESIAAFANTNDGLILIGVDDEGNVRGLPAAYKERDRLKLKVDQMIRSRIRPRPPSHFVFEEVGGNNVGKITVVRGDAPAYLLNGVVYIRHGSSDVRAQPEDLAKLFAEYGEQ